MISLSSAESEYIALSSCAKEFSWIRKLFWEIAHASTWEDDNEFSGTSVLMESTAAKSLEVNPHVSARNKHIDLKMHHVRELIQRNIVRLSHVNSFEQPADSLTKIMSPQTLKKWLVCSVYLTSPVVDGDHLQGRFKLHFGNLYSIIAV